MLALFISGEFLLHVPCWLNIYLGSFSYTSRADFIFIWGVSLTHPVLTSFLSGEFLLHIPCWLFFFFFLFLLLSREFLLHILCWLYLYLGSFSYTSRAGFIFCLGSFSYTSHAGFFSFFFLCLTHPMLASFSLNWGVSLTHPMLAWFISIWGVSLTHPVLALFISGEFVLHIPCCLYFSLGSFSYTPHAFFLSFC